MRPPSSDIKFAFPRCSGGTTQYPHTEGSTTSTCELTKQWRLVETYIDCLLPQGAVEFLINHPKKQYPSLGDEQYGIYVPGSAATDGSNCLWARLQQVQRHRHHRYRWTRCRNIQPLRKMQRKRHDHLSRLRPFDRKIIRKRTKISLSLTVSHLS